MDDSSCAALALLSRDDQSERHFDHAVAEAEQAVNLNPNCALGFLFLSDALNAAGKPEEALKAVDKAMRLDPGGRDFYAGEIGNSYLEMGRYRDAIPLLQRHLAAFPKAIWARLNLATVYAELGRDEDARAEAAEVMRISPQFVLQPPDKGGFKDLALNERYDADLRKAGLK